MCVCVLGGGGVFEETGSRDRREKFNWFKNWAERGTQTSNHKKKEKEWTCLQAKKLTRGHVLIINDPLDFDSNYWSKLGKQGCHND